MAALGSFNKVRCSQCDLFRTRRCTRISSRLRIPDRVSAARYGLFVTLLAPNLDSAVIRKARGAFFTPSELCEYVVRWAIRDASDVILEPSCGEAAFLLAAGQRLRGFAGPEVSGLGQLHGVELHGASAKSALSVLRGVGLDGHITNDDFFRVEPERRFDAVVGNPPYVRYQDFTGEARSRGRAAALRAGVPLTGLASSWAAFTVHSSLFLKPEGRLGLVLPAELLSVNYAAEVRSFLMRRFARVRLVLFTERVFPGVLEEVVLLLAEGEGSTDHCELYQARDAFDLARTDHVVRFWRPSSPGAKWSTSLVSAPALETYIELSEREAFSTLDDWGDTTLGMVTGNNRFFALSPGRARELGFTDADVIALSPPGSRHLRGLSFTPGAWNQLGDDDKATLLFRPGGEPSKAAQRYIAAGEALGVHTAYKCRVRSPWWRVPLVRPADLLLTYMNADTPRLSTNRVAVHHLNSVHGMYLRRGLHRLGRDFLPLASLNSMTLLGAETVGRAYGGGMLKLEPGEADRLPVPSRETVEAASRALSAIRGEVTKALRAGRLLDAVATVDEVLLAKHLRLSRSKIAELREAQAELSARRGARGADPGKRE
jgi:adenine-specific DNA-methyltransferase